MMAREEPLRVHGLRSVSENSIGTTSIRIQTHFVPSRSNPANNMYHMREALLNNINAQIAQPLVVDMIQFARLRAPWTDQPPTIHNEEHGYPNASARRQITGTARVSGDAVIIGVRHSDKTFQDRTDPPKRRRGQGGSGKSRDELDELERKPNRSLAERREAGDAGPRGGGTALGEGEREIVYYGNILEFGHGGDEDSLDPGKYGILVKTWREFQDRFMREIATADLEKLVGFKGATAPPKMGRNGKPNGRSIKVSRR